MKEKIIITITPPTPNGDLHLGHLSGPFLAADVMSRRLKLQGYDVMLVSYSDDYQSYLPRKTRPLRRNSFEFAKLVRDMMLNTMALVDIDIDYFLQASHSENYRHAVAHYLERVSHQVELGKGKTFYCIDCDCYGYEGFGRGHCNWCGTSSDASQCEHCARMPDITQMDHMTCMSCQQQMVATEVDQYIWRIGENYPAIAQAHEGKAARSCLTDYLKTTLQNTGEVWGITRPGDAGLTLEQLAQQPVHTWFMGLSGYQASVRTYLQEHPERGEFSDWWNSRTNLIFFLGYDCSYSHAIGYVAQQLNDPEGPAPGHFITNRFLKLDGNDFSTSRGHAIWIRDLATKYPSDAIRLYTALFAPETEVKNFVLADFDAWYQDFFLQLAEAVDALPVTRTVSDMKTKFEWEEECCQNWLKYSSIENFSISGMAQTVCRMVDVLLDRSNTPSINVWCQWAEMAQPLCPQLSASILALRKEKD